MIKIEKLTKAYREKKAVDAVNLEVNNGEIFGILGPNGAGKTTLILMLAGLLQPSSGEASINGKNIIHQGNLVKKEAGILFQDPSLDERLTGFENLHIQTVLYDVAKETREARIREMLAFAGLSEWAEITVEKYSGGMKRRLEMARSLIHQPSMLFLDEPTLGLDPSAREAVWRYVEMLKNVTVLIATNYVEEAERLCRRVAIMDRGKIVAVGSSEELKSSLGAEIGEIITEDKEGVIKSLKKISFVEDIRSQGAKITFTLKQAGGKKILNALAGKDLGSIKLSKPTLSDVYFHYTGRTLEVQTGALFKGRGKGRRRLMR